MNIPRRPLMLLAIQLLIVLSLWGKLHYDRATRPQFWVQAAQVDPELPIRGRYLALSPVLPVRGLAFPPVKNRPSYWKESQPWPDPRETYQVRVKIQPGASQLMAAAWIAPQETQAYGERPPEEPGVFAARIEESQRNLPSERWTVTLDDAIPCFVAENAPGLQHLKAGESLWMKVTLPRQGPLRVIRLAVKTANGSMRMVNP